MNISTKKIIIWILILLGIAVLLVKFSGFLLLWWIFTFFSGQITTVSGTDIWLSRAILAFTVVPLVYIMGMAISINKRKRIIGQTALFGIIGLGSLAVYLNSQGYQLAWEIIPGCLFILIGCGVLSWFFWMLYSNINKNKKR